MDGEIYISNQQEYAILLGKKNIILAKKIMLLCLNIFHTHITDTPIMVVKTEASNDGENF